MNLPLTSRRQALVGAAVLAATPVLVASETVRAASGVGGINAIPELAPQWKELDPGRGCARPGAFIVVRQKKSSYRPGGGQAGEKPRERGSLPATGKGATAA